MVKIWGYIIGETFEKFKRPINVFLLRLGKSTNRLSKIQRRRELRQVGGRGAVQFRKGTLCVITQKRLPLWWTVKHEILEKYYFVHFFVYIKIKISKRLFTISYRCLQRINACKNMYSNITKWKSWRHMLLKQTLTIYIFPDSYLQRFLCKK